MKLPGEDIVVRTAESALEGRSGGSSRCLNCGEDLVGPYCVACGQRDGSLAVTVGDFLREALDNLFSFDSRLWRTLRPLILRPGFLTVEFWQGRRAKYLPPLRLYLFISFVCFMLVSLLVPDQVVDATGENKAAPVRFTTTVEGEAVDWEGDFSESPPLVRWFAQNVMRPMLDDPERAGELFLQRLPWAIFMIMPFFGVLLRLLYRKRERYFVPHLVFALHFHSVVFLLMTLGSLGDALVGTERVGNVASLLIAIVLFLSLRRAYGEGWFRTSLKEIALVVVYVNALILTLVIVLLVTAFFL